MNVAAYSILLISLLVFCDAQQRVAPGVPPQQYQVSSHPNYVISLISFLVLNGGDGMILFNFLSEKLPSYFIIY